jgi:uncharacterized membrane protein YfcA
VTGADVAAAAAVLLAGAVQSGTGFGFSLVAVPALAAAYGPAAAVSTATLASLLQNSLTLVGERRRPEALWRVVAVLVVAGLPGMAIGAVVLKNAPDDALHLLVAVAVLGAVVARAMRKQHEPTSGVFAGAIAGALSTSTGINGPPIVLHLLRRNIEPMQTRDTLAAFFIATGVLTVVALVLAGTFHAAPYWGVALAAAAAGQFIGRGVFMRLSKDQHERITLGLLIVSALVAAAPAIA